MIGQPFGEDLSKDLVKQRHGRAGMQVEQSLVDLREPVLLLVA